MRFYNPNSLPLKCKIMAEQDIAMNEFQIVTNTTYIYGEKNSNQNKIAVEDLMKQILGNNKYVFEISSYPNLDEIPMNKFVMTYFSGGIPFSSGLCINFPMTANIQIQLAFRYDKFAYRTTWGREGEWEPWVHV